MSDRARYDGAYEEVAVIDPETNEEVDRVKRGGLLSKDAPAKIRDSLLATDEWTKVADPSGSTPKKDKE